MALPASQKRPMRAPDYTVAQPRPECLNRVTSPSADRLSGSCAALLNARQTASRVAAYVWLNVYLVARLGHTRQRGAIKPVRHEVSRDGLGGIGTRRRTDDELRYIGVRAVGPRSQGGAHARAGRAAKIAIGV